MVSIGLSFATLVIICACAIIICQYLYNQWIRYRNPFHDIIVFFKSCFRGEDVNDELAAVSLHSTHTPPTVDGARRLSRVSDKEVRRFFVLKYIIQKVCSCLIDLTFRLKNYRCSPFRFHSTYSSIIHTAILHLIESR